MSAADPYEISTDPARLDLDLVHRWLSEDSYWAKGRPRDVVRRAVEGSICFGVYLGDAQVGFARVVTDGATFAWLCDVFVLEPHQGKGLGKRLMARVTAEPNLQGLKNFVLATRDAHDLYERYGFRPLSEPGNWMNRRC